MFYNSTKNVTKYLKKLRLFRDIHFTRKFSIPNIFNEVSETPIYMCIESYLRKKNKNNKNRGFENCYPLPRGNDKVFVKR